MAIFRELGDTGRGGSAGARAGSGVAANVGAGSKGKRTRTRAARGLRRAVDPDLAPPATAAARHRGGYRRPLSRLADGAAAAAAEVLALAAPVDCVCCGAEDLALCGGCERLVRQLMRTPFRAEARAPALMDVDGSVLLPVVAAGAYRAELALAVLSFKKHGQGQLAEVLSTGLARAIRAAAGEDPGVLLVPVPTSGSAFRRRGFSPVHVLLGGLGPLRAAGAGGQSGLSTVHALHKAGLRARRGPAGRGAPGPAPGSPYGLPGFRGQPGGQKGLGRGDRAQRVRGSMRVRRGLFAPTVNGRPCIIVDDVLTTGATLAEAARALRAAGALVTGAVVLAATRPPGTRDFGAAGPAMAGKRPVNEKNKPKKDE
ncbi:ComF family protein [Arthrobacter sp. YAF17]|uniref:ComF family protein n=1 Tax=Arthrobacter sp. YAF17 TaxID=3233077 RepID=UPI003F9065C4